MAKNYSISFSLGEDLRKKLGVENCPEVQSAAQIYDAFKHIGSFDREMALVGSVDSKCRLISWNIISLGTHDQSLFRIGDVFKDAIVHSAWGVFLVHNHPSGELDPSEDDLELTQNVSKAGFLMGYPLLDHVIISVNGYRSIILPPSSPEMISQIQKASEPNGNKSFRKKERRSCATPYVRAPQKKRSRPSPK